MPQKDRGDEYYSIHEDNTKDSLDRSMPDGPVRVIIKLFRIDPNCNCLVGNHKDFMWLNCMPFETFRCSEEFEWDVIRAILFH
jgi:hypothetical protein